MTFEAVHVQGAATVARQTNAAVVLVSGLGADPESKFSYIRAQTATGGHLPGVRLLSHASLLDNGPDTCP